MLPGFTQFYWVSILLNKITEFCCCFQRQDAISDTFPSVFFFFFFFGASYRFWLLANDTKWQKKEKKTKPNKKKIKREQQARSTDIPRMDVKECAPLHPPRGYLDMPRLWFHRHPAGVERSAPAIHRRFAVRLPHYPKLKVFFITSFTVFFGQVTLKKRNIQ